MLLIANGKVNITRIGSDHQTTTVLTGARANLQGDKNGAIISSPWYQPGRDSDLGEVQFANWSVMIGGPDENPNYEPRPGDRLEFVPDFSGSTRAGIYKQVAANTGEEDIFGGISYWDLPACKARST